MPAPDGFETERLRGERLQAAQLSLLDRMHRDDTVMASLGGVRSVETTRTYLDTNLDHWRRHGYGLWMLFDRTSGRFAGRGGIRQVAVPNGEETEIAYALMAGHWGRGLATELARAFAAIGFRDLGLADLVAYTWTSNAASKRVMQKAGFTFDRHFEHNGRPHVQYRLRREDWHDGA